MHMSRLFAIVCTVLALSLFAGSIDAGGKVKNQMVKGTIKEVQLDKDVLIINQKVKNENVDRELSILETTEFVVMQGSDKKEAVGHKGLELIGNAKGASVQVKCDKDVNVLKVTVKLK
jgi:hypothetical protein